MSYLDPLNSCDDRIVRIAARLRNIADALVFVGNVTLADRVTGLASMLDGAHDMLVEGRERALMAHVGAVEDGTRNMVNATLATAQK
jgi:hypothetical protein